MTHTSSLTPSSSTSFRASRPVCVPAGERFPLTTNHPLCGGTSDGGPIAATSSGLWLGVGRPSLCSGAGRVTPRLAPWSTCDRDRRVSSIPSACPSHVCAPRCDVRINRDPRKGVAARERTHGPVGPRILGEPERAVGRYVALSTRPFAAGAGCSGDVTPCTAGVPDGRVEGRPSEHTIAAFVPREISQKGNQR